MASLLVEFRVRSDLCPLVSLTEEFDGVEVEYLEMARLQGEEFLELFEVRGPQAKEFGDAVVSAQGICKVSIVDEAPDRLVCQGVIGVRCIRSLLASQGWIPLKVRASRGLETVSVAVSDLDEARDLVNFVKANYRDFELSKITSRGVPAHASRRSLKTFGLTARQEEVLRRALSGGYFDLYRKRSAKDIAKSMGIDRSTFSRHLRIALKKVLSGLLK